jgi:hypothetical protein
LINIINFWGENMLDKIIKIANILDNDGRYIESDTLTISMMRIADVLQDERQQSIGKHFKDLENSVIESPNLEEIMSGGEKPPKTEIAKPMKVRPGLKEMMTSQEGWPKSPKQIVKDLIDLRNPEELLKYRDYFLAEARNGDPYAERVVEIIDKMESMTDDARSRPGFTPYGSSGIWSPAGSRTLFEGPKGGKHNVTPFFLNQEQAHSNAKKMRDLLNFLLSDERGRARLKTDYSGGDRDSEKPVTSNDLVVDKLLEQSFAPEMDVLQNLRKQKAEGEGKEFNTTPLYPDQYKGWHSSKLRKLNPKSSEFYDEKRGSKEKIYKILDQKIQQFMQDFNMDIETATKYAVASLVVEGSNGIGGLDTWRFEDTNEARPHSVPGKKNKFITKPQIWKGVIDPYQQEQSGLGSTYEDYDPEKFDSLSHPIEE